MKTGVIGNFVLTGLEVKSEDLEGQDIEIKIKEEQDMDTAEEVRCEGNDAFVVMGQEVNKDMGLAILQKLDEISKRLENVEKSQKMIVNHLKICSQEVNIEDSPEIINVPPELDTSTSELPSVNNSKTIFETHTNEDNLTDLQSDAAGVENQESDAVARRKNKKPNDADSEADDDWLQQSNQKKQKYSHVNNRSISKLNKSVNLTGLQPDAAAVENEKSDAAASRKNKKPNDADSEADGGKLRHPNQKKPKHKRSLSKLVQRCIEYDDEDEVNVVVDAVPNESSSALTFTLNANKSDLLTDEIEPNGLNLNDCFSPLAVSLSEGKEISRKNEEPTKAAEMPVFIHENEEFNISLSNFETLKGGIFIKDCDVRQRFIFPSFPKFVEPYLHGTASEKQIPNMRRVLVQEIVHYLDSNNLINDKNNMKRRWQYADLQRDLLIYFPNIIREECKRRRNYKGELAALIIKISEKRRHATASSKGKV